ncbi:MAG: hypothetical protein M3162_01990, partial [Thermoproteota archaeon]|nr:hypothetical protein [Thermoproteota archaeon]
MKGQIINLVISKKPARTHRDNSKNQVSSIDRKIKNYVHVIIINTMTSGRYFNRGVMTLDSPYIGHVVRETDDKIVVFGPGEERFDVPKSEIKTTGRNVLLGLNVY